MALINMNGITTVVGLSETDGLTRSVENLYAKTHALCEEGDALVPAFVANLSKLMTSLPNIIIAVAVALRFCRAAEGNVFDFVRTPYRTLKCPKG